MTIAFLLWLGAESPLTAELIDNLDTTQNFGLGFNGAIATANGNSTVTISRTQSGIDAGIDWMHGGTTFLSLASEGRLTIFPASSGSINGGIYDVNILFWTSTSGFLTEVHWLDTTSTAPQTLNVDQFAADSGVSPSAAQYFPRFRIEPQAFSGGNPGFTFNRIQATLSGASTGPEPSSSVLIIAGLILCFFRFKFSRFSRSS